MNNDFQRLLEQRNAEYAARKATEPVTYRTPGPRPKTQAERDNDTARAAVVGTGAVLSKFFSVCVKAFFLVLGLLFVAMVDATSVSKYGNHNATMGLVELIVFGFIVSWLLRRLFDFIRVRVFKRDR